MKVAVISDVHGNRLALEAVLDDIAEQSVDATLNLGDLVSGPTQPRQALDIMMSAGHPTIAGNHERIVLSPEPERLDRFVGEQLTAEQKQWMAALPKTLAVDEIFMCHGTPDSDTQPWLDNWYNGRDTTLPDEASVTARAEGLDFPVLLCGHTHIPRMVRLRDGRMIVNPGSVGMQFVRGSPDARYAILERRNGRWQAALRIIPYDFAAAAEQARANGFGNWKDVLTSGWNGTGDIFT